MKKLKKIFVLDTSVILHSHDSIMNFEENDIGIPITVLEELDEMKKGNDTKNFEARDTQDLLSMCLLEMSVKLLADDKKVKVDSSIENNLNALESLIDQHLK